MQPTWFVRERSEEGRISKYLHFTPLYSYTWQISNVLVYELSAFLTSSSDGYEWNMQNYIYSGSHKFWEDVERGRQMYQNFYVWPHLEEWLSFPSIFGGKLKRKNGFLRSYFELWSFLNLPNLLTKSMYKRPTLYMDMAPWIWVKMTWGVSNSSKRKYTDLYDFWRWEWYYIIHRLIWCWRREGIIVLKMWRV